MELLTHGFSERDVSQHLRRIDAETALCFSDEDKAMIRGEIEVRFGFGSLARFTQDLRLRFLLRPMGYDVDLDVLRARGREEAYHFGPLRVHLDPSCPATEPEPEPELEYASRASKTTAAPLALVVGGAGEGKSTMAAAMLDGGDGGGVFVHAAHFCKRADARRQDVVAVACSLAYQLARHFDEFRQHVLALAPGEVEKVQVDQDAAVHECVAHATNRTPLIEQYGQLLPARD